MERPTKPVMWTDEEASTRLKKWLIKLGWVGERNYIHNYLGADNYGKFFDLTPLMIRVNIRDSYSNEHSFIDDISAILQYESITLDSLLHDLNIIKPIGRLEYTSEWIDKILSGQKTMDILPIQHTCGYYELWDTDRQEVRGIVEVMSVSILRFRIESNNLPSFSGVFQFNGKVIAQKCGFKMFQDFITHHHDNFQSVKYAITYRVVDIKGVWNEV